MIALGVLGTAALLALSVGLWRFTEPQKTPPPDLLEGRIRQLVVVTLKSGRAFRGLLAEADDRVVVLRDAELLGAEPGNVGVDGEVIVLLGEVEFVQRP